MQRIHLKLLGHSGRGLRFTLCAQERAGGGRGAAAQSGRLPASLPPGLPASRVYRLTWNPPGSALRERQRNPVNLWEDSPVLLLYQHRNGGSDADTLRPQRRTTRTGLVLRVFPARAPEQARGRGARRRGRAGSCSGLLGGLVCPVHAAGWWALRSGRTRAGGGTWSVPPRVRFPTRRCSGHAGTLPQPGGAGTCTSNRGAPAPPLRARWNLPGAQGSPTEGDLREEMRPDNEAERRTLGLSLRCPPAK